MPDPTCPSCGAPLPETGSCWDYFYQFLYWENEDSALPEGHRDGVGAVHHLAVLCYYLQHPGQYSPRGLEEAMRLLDAFIHGASPSQMRAENRERVASGARAWTVTARPDDRAAYPHPVRWRLTAADVVAGGKTAYVESVRAWARAIHADLQASGNLPARAG